MQQCTFTRLYYSCCFGKKILVSYALRNKTTKNSTPTGVAVLILSFLVYYQVPWC